MAYYQVRYAKGGCIFDFPYARVDVDEDPQYAADGMTLVGVRYVFHVSGVLTGNTLAAFQSNLALAEHVLLEPRGGLSIRWSENGSSWTTLWSIEPGTDVAWGPKPGPLNFTRFSGGKAATYSWSCETTVKNCWDSCTTVNNSDRGIVLSVSRRFSHAIDANGLTTRSVSGELTVVSGSIAQGKTADVYRERVTPPLPANFRREDQSFNLSEDGRTLTFTITDKEVCWTLPQPITTGRASYAVAYSPIGGIATFTLSGSFEAPPDVSKDVILEKVSLLLASRLPSSTASFVWSDCRITEDVYGNRLDFDFSWRSAGQQGESGPLNNFERLGAAPPESDGISQEVGPYGLAQLRSPAPVSDGGGVFDACKPIQNYALSSPPVAAPRPPGDPGEQRDPASTIGTVLTTGLSTEHAEAPYIAYRETFSWEVNNHIVSFAPKVAGPSAEVVVQQTALPTVHVVQAGYATREGSRDQPARPASPMYSRSAAALKHAYISPSSIVPLQAEGQYQSTVHWRYVFVLRTPPAATQSLELRYPVDVRDATRTPVSILDAGPIVAAPNGNQNL